jgi:hypothetical protein
MTDNLPVSWEEQMKADARSQLANERPAMSFMSLKSGVMSIGDNAVEGNELDCIIVASVSENQWFKDRYDPNVRSNPTCYAIGEGKSDTLTPYAESEAKQAESCGDCDKFQWGSDPNGGRGKACKERRKLALIPADMSAEVLLLSIPPTSLKNWANHVAKVVATTGMSTLGVISKIKVAPNAKNQFEVQFTIVDRVPAEHLPALMAKKAEMTAVMTQPYPEIEEQPEPKGGKKRKF